MNLKSLIVVAFALAAPAALAQHNHDGHQTMKMAADTPAAPAAFSEGVVRKVDKSAGKLTIAHGPLENLGMPGMTMAFRVGDAAMLDKVKEGDKIRFVAERVNGVFSVTKLEVSK